MYKVPGGQETTVGPIHTLRALGLSCLLFYGTSMLSFILFSLGDVLTFVTLYPAYFLFEAGYEIAATQSTLLPEVFGNHIVNISY